MHNINEKQYKLFQPAERASLTISALARNDLKEADRLWETCPRLSYKAIDFEYTNRVITSQVITLAFFEQCVYHYNSIKAAETELLTLSLKNFVSIDQEEILSTRSYHVALLKALYQGAKMFCQQIGINGNDFLETVPDHVCFGIDEFLSSKIEPSKEDIERFKNTFLGYWPF